MGEGGGGEEGVEEAGRGTCAGVCAFEESGELGGGAGGVEELDLLPYIMFLFFLSDERRS